jgi:hypothetical protein
LLEETRNLFVFFAVYFERTGVRSVTRPVITGSALKGAEAWGGGEITSWGAQDRNEVWTDINGRACELSRAQLFTLGHRLAVSAIPGPRVAGPSLQTSLQGKITSKFTAGCILIRSIIDFW